jgi:hypothetical protein
VLAGGAGDEGKMKLSSAFDFIKDLNDNWREITGCDGKASVMEKSVIGYLDREEDGVPQGENRPDGAVEAVPDGRRRDYSPR